MNKLYFEIYENSVRLAILPAKKYLLEVKIFDLEIPQLIYNVLRVDPIIFDLIMPYNPYQNKYVV